MNIQTSLGVFRRYLMWIRYDGSRFPEFAKGLNGYGVVDTFQRCLERCIYPTQASTSKIFLAPSSRTDSGVHALRTSIIVHAPLETQGGLDDNQARKSSFLDEMNILMNHVAPDGFQLLNFHSVHPGFCCRKHVSYRRYVYRLIVAKNDDIYTRMPNIELISDGHYSWLLPPNFNIEKAANICRKLEGLHNFASFFKHPRRDQLTDPYWNTMKVLNNVSISKGEGYALTSPDHHYYNITIISRSFIREQIRRLVAVIAAHACGRLSEKDVQWLLETPHPQNFFAFRGMKAAPPNGLFLADVVYDQEAFTNPNPVVSHAWDLAKDENCDVDLSG
uniref:tRNA pseudouridine synthase n=1 Tax=Panagrolaimus sp. JU765 TaxID=591449 RepID=A0AC34Q9L7_9BILA